MIKLYFKKYLHLRELFVNISSLSIVQLTNLIFPAITLPYLVRVLGPEKYGLVNFAIITSSYFLSISEYGFNLSATKEISIYRDNKNLVDKIFVNVFYSKALLGIISIALFTFIILTFEKFTNEKELYFLSFGYVIGSVLFPMWYFQGIEKMKYLPLLFFIPRLIGTVFIFVLVTQPEDYIRLIIIYSCIQIISGLAGFLFAVRKNKITMALPEISGIKQQLKTGFRMFLSNISIGIYTSSAPILLGIIVGNTAVGYYVAADKIRSLVSSFLSNISTGVYPYVNKLLQNSREGFIRFNLKLLKLRATLTFILSGLLFIFSNLIVKVVLGNSFEESVIILKILSFLPFIITLSNSFGIQIMLPLNKEKQFLVIVTFAAIINLILSYLLISNFADTGAAFSFLITEIFVTVVMFLYVVNKAGKSGELNEV